MGKERMGKMRVGEGKDGGRMRVGEGKDWWEDESW